MSCDCKMVGLIICASWSDMCLMSAWSFNRARAASHVSNSIWYLDRGRKIETYDCACMLEGERLVALAWHWQFFKVFPTFTRRLFKISINIIILYLLMLFKCMFYIVVNYR